MINYKIINKLMPITDEEKKILAGDNKINHKLYMTNKKDVINSTLLLDEGKLITIRPHVRFVDFPEHSHDFVEVVYMCSGKTHHIVNGKDIILSEGELLFLSRRAKHGIKRAGEGDIAVNFIVLPQFFDYFTNVLEDGDSPLKSFVSDWLCGSGGPDFLLFKVADILPIQNLMENLIWTLLYDTKNKRSVIRRTMELLILQLLSYTDSLEYTTPNDGAVLSVLRYIEDNYKNGTLEEAAKLMHCNFYWLSKEIKKKTGMTYTELLQKKRLSQATFYLKNTNMKITEISRLVGYENTSYFYRVFFKTYDVTPKEYRDGK